MKVQDLKDDDLDHYVALALGAKDTASPDENAAATGLMFHWRMWTGMPRGGVFVLVNRASLSEPWRPSRNWAQAGWLVEKLRLDVYTMGDQWEALMFNDVDDEHELVRASGDTPTEAIARVIVARSYGEEVPA